MICGALKRLLISLIKKIFDSYEKPLYGTFTVVASAVMASEGVYRCDKAKVMASCMYFCPLGGVNGYNHRSSDFLFLGIRVHKPLGYI